ncbi:MAG: hypothetical protein HC881_08455 [Leptolyngbyaceae cyanobacterium SL_7_1]|nr:hypothetical protein [Leptolyngbyaceae cyanobacterium SL_7_1]
MVFNVLRSWLSPSALIYLVALFTLGCPSSLAAAKAGAIDPIKLAPSQSTQPVEAALEQPTQPLIAQQIDVPRDIPTPIEPRIIEPRPPEPLPEDSPISATAHRTIASSPHPSRGNCPRFAYGGNHRRAL